MARLERTSTHSGFNAEKNAEDEAKGLRGRGFTNVNVTKKREKDFDKFEVTGQKAIPGHVRRAERMS